MNPNRMSCGEVRDKLPLYVGGDLDPEVLDAVRGHLDLCGECARRAARAGGARRVLLASFQGSEGDAARPGLWPGIRARLHSEGLIHPSERPVAEVSTAKARRSRWGWALAPLAAAAVVVMILQLSGGVEPDLGPGRVPDREFVGGPGPVADVPVVNTLRPVDPRDAELAVPYRHRGQRAEFPSSASGEASLAGFQSDRVK